MLIWFIIDEQLDSFQDKEKWSKLINNSDFYKSFVVVICRSSHPILSKSRWTISRHNDRHEDQIASGPKLGPARNRLSWYTGHCVFSGLDDRMKPTLPNQSTGTILWDTEASCTFCEKSSSISFTALVVVTIRWELLTSCVTTIASSFSFDFVLLSVECRSNFYIVPFTSNDHLLELLVHSVRLTFYCSPSGRLETLWVHSFLFCLPLFFTCLVCVCVCVFERASERVYQAALVCSLTL